MTRDPEILLQAENQYPNEENKKKLGQNMQNWKNYSILHFQPARKMALGLDVSPLVLSTPCI